jgi:NAD(P)-dependent dehydrogenase (short-subunit alcohol dehydrogenase family)
MVPGATENLTAADMEKVLSVNVVGPFLCSREAIKRMKVSGGGRIINVGSISSASPRADSATYTTSKFAIQGLSYSLALDCRPHNIAVGSIHPGNVESELLTPEVIAERKATEGFIQPEDVAQCVLTMASLPYSANILDLTVIPTKQPLVGRG